MTTKSAFLVAAASLLFAGLAVAQPYGMGPGMMGGYGGGYGMGSGMGSGTVGGQGGGCGMGPGMMGGHADTYAGLELTPEQGRRIAGIREETARVMWQLMGTMHQHGYHMHGMFGPGHFDEDVARQAYEMVAETHKAMFEKQLDARKRIDAVLTDEQRAQLRKDWGGR